MEKSLRRFARRILLVHLALLVPLLAVIFVASREVYQSARAQALEQAQKQQQLLVNETASGLRGYYDSIFGDLELFAPVSPDEEGAEDRIPDAETGEPVIKNPRGLRPSLMLAQQLNGRVFHLFLVEKGTHRVIQKYGVQANNPTVEQLVERNRDWIDALNQPTITPLERFSDARGETRGYNLIGVPTAQPRAPRRPAVNSGGPSVLIASVPVRGAAKRFLDEVNRSNLSGALLLDDAMTIMAASRPQLIGTSAAAQADPHVKAVMQELGKTEGSGTALLPTPFQIGDEQFAPSVVSVEPVRVLDKQWHVVIASRLSDVDAVVSRLFRRAAFWAIFVAASMTAILVSTSAQLIRNRARMERERHELLEKELRQARDIQLAWLPRDHGNRAGLDIATVNQPASRISGDFYNWFELPDGRTCVAIGDVTGHGMAAAFLMATTQLLVRNTMPRTGHPGRCLEEINRQLCTQVFNGQFVTLLILVLDPASRTVEVGTAGHPAPLCSDGQGFRPLKLEPNLVLGVEKDSAYPTESFKLPANSAILLYTDGVVDTESTDGDRFGLERLRGSVRGGLGGAQSLIRRAVGAIESFRGTQSIADDLTLVAIQLQPLPAVQPAPPAELSGSAVYGGDAGLGQGGPLPGTRRAV